MKTAREILQDWKGYLHKSEHVDVMSFLKLEMTIDQLITEAVIAERERDVQAVMDLALTLREMGGEPRLIDLVKLAKRIRACTPAKGDGK